MKILYSSSGDTSLLFNRLRRSAPSFELVNECASFISKVGLAKKAREPYSQKIIKLDATDIKNEVRRCEPSHFLLLRDLIPGIKRDCERLLPDSAELKAAKKVCVRFPSDASATELLAAGVFAKMCGVSHLVLSMPQSSFTPEHALAARLTDTECLLLCDGPECVAEVAFGGDGDDKYDLLTGHDDERFSVAAGIVSSFLNVRVYRPTNAFGYILTEPYDSELLACDLEREWAEHPTRQFLLISSNEEKALASVGWLYRNKGDSVTAEGENIIGNTEGSTDADSITASASDRITILITSSDAESLAAARKLDAVKFYTYGINAGRYPDGSKEPPLMREVLSPSSVFPLRVYDLFEDATSSHAQSVTEFAGTVAKHVQNALSPRDIGTVGVRLEKM